MGPDAGIMNTRLYLSLLLLLVLSCITQGAEAPPRHFKIHYNSSNLTVITVESNKLECAWHTYRKDLIAMRANLESFDKHTSSITLTPTEVMEFLAWARNAIKTEVTADQKKSRRGYTTVLSVGIDGKNYSPNHKTCDGFKEIVATIIKNRRDEGF